MEKLETKMTELEVPAHLLRYYLFVIINTKQVSREISFSSRNCYKSCAQTCLELRKASLLSRTQMENRSVTRTQRRMLYSFIYVLVNLVVAYMSKKNYIVFMNISITTSKKRR